MSENKEIVYIKPIRTIVLLTTCWVFVILGIWTKEILGTLLFGLGAILYTWPFIDPRKQVLFIGTKKYKQHLKKLDEEMFKNRGVFTYNPNGFELTINNKQHTVLWAAIRAIFCYNVYSGTDKVCADIFYDTDRVFTITEYTEGWYAFIWQLDEHLPSFDENWDVSDESPEMKEHLTLLYEKDDRALADALTVYYKDGREINPDDYI